MCLWKLFVVRGHLERLLLIWICPLVSSVQPIGSSARSSTGSQVCAWRHQTALKYSSLWVSSSFSPLFSLFPSDILSTQPKRICWVLTLSKWWEQTAKFWQKNSCMLLIKSSGIAESKSNMLNCQLEEATSEVMNMERENTGKEIISKHLLNKVLRLKSFSL